MTGDQQRVARSALVAAVMIPIAFAHVLDRPFGTGRFADFASGYLFDIIVPFGFYFLLVPKSESFRPLRSWRLKAAVIFGLAATVEVLQGFGIAVLGETFDPVDFAMYGTGVLAAVAADRLLLTPFVSFWPFAD